MAGRRKKKAEEHENHERWLLTYADMITLLMAFFIMMYSMSVLNITKFHQVAISIRSGFGGQMKGQGRSLLSTAAGVGDRPNILPQMGAMEFKIISDQLHRYTRRKHLDKVLHMKTTARGLVVTLSTDKMLFPKGKATITPETEQVLAKLSALIQKTDHPIRVEGHTDDLPIHNSQFGSNWQLSTARATAVVQFMVEHAKLDSGRCSVMGYAATRPLVPNTSEENRALNRRVDIVILKENEHAAPDGSKPDGQAGEEKSSKEAPLKDKEAATPDGAEPIRQG